MNPGTDTAIHPAPISQQELDWTPHDPAVIVSVPAGKILECTESFAAFLARDRNQLRGQFVMELLTGTSWNTLSEILLQIAEARDTVRECLTFLIDDNPTPLQVEVTQLTIAGQSLALVQCDKTILLRNPSLGEAELAIRAYILDRLEDGIFAVEPSGRFVTCNEFFSRTMFGCSRLSVRGRLLDELTAHLPPTRLRLCRGFANWLSSPGSREQDYVEETADDGTLIRYRLSKAEFPSPLTGIIVVGALVDLSREVSMERNLRKSERVLREIFENVFGGLALVGVDETVELCNESFARIFGVPGAADFVGRSLLDFIPDDQHEKLLQENASRRKGASSSYELSICTPAGNRRDIEIAVNPRYDDQGRFIGTYSSILNVTDRVQIERQFRLLATAVESAAEAILLTDRDGIIQYVNPAFETTTGYALEEVIGRSTSILKSGVHSKEFYQELWSTILAGKTWRGRVVNRDSRGHLFHEEGSISPVHDSQGEIAYFVCVKRDITKEIQLQSQLVQSQKMESLALMAGGIAHDFNNILAGIQGNTLIATERLATLAIDFPEAQVIAESCKRGADIVRSLLTYSRRIEHEPLLLDLTAFIRKLADLLRYFAGTSNSLQLDIPQQPLYVRIDPAALDQILSNLLLNARDAVAPNRGVINLTVGAIADSDHFPNGAVALCVEDNGCGIAAESLSKIFDPFFTTKDVGKGTGLGLTNVKSAVTNAGGRIEVTSQLGQGTKFTIFFPVAGDALHADSLIA